MPMGSRSNHRRQRTDKTMMKTPPDEFGCSNNKAMNYVVRVGEAVLNLADSVSSQLNRKTKSSDSGPELNLQEMTEYLMNDPKLWNEFRKELADEKVATNIGVGAVLNRFLNEHRNEIELQQRKAVEAAAEANGWLVGVAFGTLSNPLFMKSVSKESSGMSVDKNRCMTLAAYPEIQPVSTKKSFQFNAKPLSSTFQFGSNTTKREPSGKMVPSNSPLTDMSSFAANNCNDRKSDLLRDFGNSVVDTDCDTKTSNLLLDLGKGDMWSFEKQYEVEVSLSSNYEVTSIQGKLGTSPMFKSNNGRKHQRSFYDAQFHFSRRQLSQTDTHCSSSVVRKVSGEDVFWV